MSFKHPTGNKPKVLHIVCSGATVRDYMAANISYDMQIPIADEVWSLNKSLRFLRADFGFILDDLVGEHSKSRQYFQFVCDLSKVMPIMTTIKDATLKQLITKGGGNFDNIIEYPIHKVRDRIGWSFYKQRGEHPPGYEPERLKN